jgi:hypothetical protein
MNANIQTLIHVGTELVVLTGLTFWLNKRLGSVETNSNLLNERLIKCEQVIQQMQQHINRYDLLFSDRARHMPSQRIMENIDPRSVEFHPNIEQLEQKQNKSEEIPSHRDNKRDIEPEELDNLLSNELNDLKSQTENKITQEKELKKQSKKKKEIPVQLENGEKEE